MSVSNDSVRLSVPNGQWEAWVSPEKGALLERLVLHADHPREVLYDRERREHGPEGWTGHAPWLWPAVGRTLTEEEAAEGDQRGEAPEKGHYRMDGVSRPMPIHGFARDKAWSVRDRDDTSTKARVVCETGDDRESRALYPFSFVLESVTTVFRSYLTHAFRVTASQDNASPMPFSVGNHITVDVPGLFGLPCDRVLLTTPCSVQYPLRPCCLLDGTQRERSLGDGQPLHLLSDQVLAGYPKGMCHATLNTDNLRLRVSQREVPGPNRTAWSLPRDFAFVFYGDPNKGFFCPEPWLGFPNALNTGRGAVRLPPGETFHWEMTLHILSSPYLAE